MAVFKPFRAYRPKPEVAAKVAAKPYDVLNSEEARAEAQGNPLSFLNVGKPEICLDPGIDIYDAKVYEKGRENLEKLISDGHLVADEGENFYIYAQTMNGRTQVGLVGCASVEDYFNDVIKKHEYTRPVKEEDRCNHVRVTNAHTGPIFLTYQDKEKINDMVAHYMEYEPETDFVSEDGVRQRVWVIGNPSDKIMIQGTFSNIRHLYVADGHHRSAAAAIVGKERKEANPDHHGNEEYNLFLAVLFPASQLYIMDYNRLVKDLANLSEEDFLDQVGEFFSIESASEPVKPAHKGEFGLYLGEGEWYKLKIDPEYVDDEDPVASLDVAILQKYIMHGILGIADPRTDNRIDFVGGIRGLEELMKRVDSGEMAAAFSLHPTSINELMAIADSGNVMPPKSTWFEPKLKDGLFVHFLD